MKYGKTAYKLHWIVQRCALKTQEKKTNYNGPMFVYNKVAKQAVWREDRIAPFILEIYHF